MSSDLRTFVDQPAPEPIRYMLRSWPQAALLGTDTDRVRMANLLVGKELSMDELADLSGLTLYRSAEFLQVLHENDLLEVHVPAIRVGEMPTQPADLDDCSVSEAPAPTVAPAPLGQTRQSR